MYRTITNIDCKYDYRAKDAAVKKKRTRIAAKYEPGFLQTLDGRLEVAKILNSAFNEVTDDMGGKDTLCHTQLALAERFVFLVYVLRSIETRIALNPKESDELLSRWIQGLNSLNGLAKVIGLKRKAKKVKSLQTYIEGSKNGKRKKQRKV